MAGTKQGGQKTKQKNLENFGPDHFKRIGRLGAMKRRVKRGGFNDPVLARKAGRKGGKAKAAKK